MMSRFDRLPDRALELAHNVGDRFRDAVPDDVGDRVRRALPSRAGGLMEAGVALGAMKTGGRVATAFVRRNPAVVVAVIAGGGLLWYAAHRRAKKAERGLLESRSHRTGDTLEHDERAAAAASDSKDDGADITPGAA